MTWEPKPGQPLAHKDTPTPEGEGLRIGLSYWVPGNPVPSWLAPWLSAEEQEAMQEGWDCALAVLDECAKLIRGRSDDERRRLLALDLIRIEKDRRTKFDALRRSQQGDAG